MKQKLKVIILSEGQWLKLKDIFDEVQDEGPYGHGWKSEAAKEIESAIENAGDAEVEIERNET